MDKIKIHISTYKFFYASIITATLIFFLIFWSYKKGYRFTENFMIGKVGNLSMIISIPETRIYIDKKLPIITENENQEIDIPISPQKHTIIVSKDGYFPWKKDIYVKSKEKINFKPVFVSKNPSGFMIYEDNSEFWKIKNKILTDKLPTKEESKISENGESKLWVEDNAVFVETASTTQKVIQPDFIIRNVYFYKDRSDFLIISVSNGVFAIETEKENTQNFLPIYKGIMPRFIPKESSEYLYILDGESLMEVKI